MRRPIQTQCFRQQIAAYREAWQKAMDPAAATSPAESGRLLQQLAAMKHTMLVAQNPLLADQKLILVKRFTYDSQHYYDDYYHGPSAWGGNLCLVSLADGKTTPLVPQLAGGIFDHYDLSFDARRIVFGYRACQPTGYRIYEGRRRRQRPAPTHLPAGR